MSEPAADQRLPLIDWAEVRGPAANGSATPRAFHGERLNRPDGATAGRSVAGYVQAHASQIVRFVLIGAGIAALNLALLHWFRAHLRLSDPVAVTAMYSLGALLHFMAHRWITYGAQHRPVVPQGLRYSVMLIWNFLLMQTLVSIAARASVSPYIAVMASTGCNMVCNFLYMTHIVFTKGRPAPLAGLPGAMAKALQQRGMSAG